MSNNTLTAIVCVALIVFFTVAIIVVSDNPKPPEFFTMCGMPCISQGGLSCDWSKYTKCLRDENLTIHRDL